MSENLRGGDFFWLTLYVGYSTVHEALSDVA